MHIPVFHVEAGLRSYNMAMPEEINRTLCDRISQCLFCPSATAVENLKMENITDGVLFTGDVMFDAVRTYGAEDRSVAIDDPYAVLTLHRAENTDDPNRLKAIMTALARAPVKIVFPMHPRTRAALSQSGIGVPDTVEVLEPQSYLDMLALMRRSRFVVTDSGGLQKEAYFLARPCITLRDETEWTELVDLGVNRLTGAHEDMVVEAMDWAMHATVGHGHSPYGNGDAGTRIVSAVQHYFDRM